MLPRTNTSLRRRLPSTSPLESSPRAPGAGAVGNTSPRDHAVRLPWLHAIAVDYCNQRPTTATAHASTDGTDSPFGAQVVVVGLTPTPPPPSAMKAAAAGGGSTHGGLARASSRARLEVLVRSQEPPRSLPAAAVREFVADFDHKPRRRLRHLELVEDARRKSTCSPTSASSENGNGAVDANNKSTTTFPDVTPPSFIVAAPAALQLNRRSSGAKMQPPSPLQRIATMDDDFFAAKAAESQHTPRVGADEPGGPGVYNTDPAGGRYVEGNEDSSATTSPKHSGAMQHENSEVLPQQQPMPEAAAAPVLGDHDAAVAVEVVTARGAGSSSSGSSNSESSSSTVEQQTHTAAPVSGASGAVSLESSLRGASTVPTRASSMTAATTGLAASLEIPGESAQAHPAQSGGSSATGGSHRPRFVQIDAVSPERSRMPPRRLVRSQNNSANVSVAQDLDAMGDRVTPVHPLSAQQSSQDGTPGWDSMQSYHSAGRRTAHSTVFDDDEDFAGFRSINGYLILGELGRGSFGRVYLVEKGGQEYAMKIIDWGRMLAERTPQPTPGITPAASNHCTPARPMMAPRVTSSWDVDPELPVGVPTHILREVAVMKKLKHRRILKLIEVIDHNEERKLLLILPKMESALMDINPSTGQIYSAGKSEFEAKSIVRQVLAGLGYMHAHKVVHLDIKPQNILLDDAGNAYIADFGTASISSGAPVAVGTRPFLPPEAFADGVDGASSAHDVWALGITLYMMLFSRHPFIFKFARLGFDQMGELIRTVSLEFPEYPVVSSECKDAVRRMLDRSPRSRITCAALRRHEWFSEPDNTPSSVTATPLVTSSRPSLPAPPPLPTATPPESTDGGALFGVRPLVDIAAVSPPAAFAQAGYSALMDPLLLSGNDLTSPKCTNDSFLRSPTAAQMADAVVPARDIVYYDEPGSATSCFDDAGDAAATATMDATQY